ncbi:MAG: cation transporter [Clostridia bacterium]|nr:cation transporter [Clostridia bacterium]
MGKNMFLAFLLNLAFSAFELVGSLVTGSVAIASDAVHDLGDAAAIGISCLFEKKSNRQPDETFTYGYRRYSVLAGCFSTLVLILGSVAVIWSAIGRLLAPQPIHYNGMVIFALVGVLINGIAAFVTREGDSVNQKAVNLHMLEDVLGWIVVLIGAIVMKLTDFSLIDPLMSIGVAVFILCHAVKNLRHSVDLLLEKAPDNMTPEQIKALLTEIPGVTDVHHIHLWSIDGIQNYATMHIVSDEPSHALKETIRKTLDEHGIFHVTLEMETSDDCCGETNCFLPEAHASHHHHHHHH